MIYKEEERDLFDVEVGYFFAQCISADFAMGKGIAVEFNKRFDTKNKLTQTYPDYLGKWKDGDCIREGKVLNLITKKRYYQKPTLTTLKNALNKMKEICLDEGISRIAMPKIGCGLDRLNWLDVQYLIFHTFEDTDIEVLVCYI